MLREEFVNIAIVMTETGDDGGGFAGLHFTSDWRRARALDPHVDIEWLEAMGRDVRRRLTEVQQRPLLLHELLDSCSNTIQLSAVGQSIAEDPEKELKDLAAKMVEMPDVWSPEKERLVRAFGRRRIHRAMTDAFRAAGVWGLLDKDLPVKAYTYESDTFTIDFGYSRGVREVKLFHAVSLVDIGSETRMFPLRVAKIAPRMAELKRAQTRFTAVVEDQFDENDRAVRTVVAFMQAENIRVAKVREMPAIAEVARRELGA